LGRIIHFGRNSFNLNQEKQMTEQEWHVLMQDRRFGNEMYNALGERARRIGVWRVDECARSAATRSNFRWSKTWSDLLIIASSTLKELK
jgi:hypothetical protein